MRKRGVSLMAVLALIGATVPAQPGVAHTWANYCSGTSLSLLNIWENEGDPGSGATDSACSSGDSEWGDSAGEIRNFHDKMTSYHVRDKADTAGKKVCIYFYRDQNQGGGYFISNNDAPLTDGGHFPEANVGSAYNDWVDSHVAIYTTNANCPP